MIGTYDLRLVTLSIAIAILAAYTTLDLALQAMTVKGKARIWWVIAGAISMGIGTWAMHFIGILAYKLPIAKSFNPSIVAISVLPAILASAIALSIVSREITGIWELLFGSLLMGVGIATMHYTGMAAMQVDAIASYNFSGVAISVAIAILASFVALWLVFKMQNPHLKTHRWHKIGGAIVMGIAVSAMHYTGMAAVCFSSLESGIELFSSSDITWLSIVVGIVTYTILGVGLLVSAKAKVLEKTASLITINQKLAAEIAERKQAEVALQKLNQELESKVQDRTAQLSQVIVQLETEIGDRKQAEIKLQEQSQFLQSIWDGVNYGILIVDVLDDGEEFRFAQFNPAMSRISHTSMDCLIGKTLAEATTSEIADIYRKQYQRCVQTGESFGFEERVQVRGKETWFLLNLTPLKNSMGKIDRIVVTLIDISDRKQVEMQLRQSEACLKQQAQELQSTLEELQQTQAKAIQAEKMSSLGQLVAGVAHEINNPVSFIFGNISHAREYTDDLLHLVQLYQRHYPHLDGEIQKQIKAIDLEFISEDLPKLINSMEVGAERIQNIVMSLRTFSRMDESEMKKVNIHAGIDSTLTLLQHRLKATNLRPEIQVIKEYGNLPPVECYAGQLNQVFMNLLCNGIDALEEDLINGKQFIPTISIRTQINEDRELAIAIADNGCGIPPHVRSKLFDPFFTTKPVGKGTGMGLSISYQIVTQKHGGSLEFSSAPGQGTEFTIAIPLRQLTVNS